MSETTEFADHNQNNSTFKQSISPLSQNNHKNGKKLFATKPHIDSKNSGNVQLPVENFLDNVDEDDFRENNSDSSQSLLITEGEIEKGEE